MPAGCQAVGRNQRVCPSGPSGRSWLVEVPGGAFPGCGTWGVLWDPCHSVCLSRICLLHCFQGVTRLADISLHDPVSISVLDESHGPSSPEDHADLELCAPQPGDELDGFAIPEGLDQYVTLVPSKLRLVCLAAFLLQKCKVGGGSSRPPCRERPTLPAPGVAARGLEARAQFSTAREHGRGFLFVSGPAVVGEIGGR